MRGSHPSETNASGQSRASCPHKRRQEQEEENKSSAARRPAGRLPKIQKGPSCRPTNRRIWIMPRMKMLSEANRGKRNYYLAGHDFYNDTYLLLFGGIPEAKWTFLGQSTGPRWPALCWSAGVDGNWRGASLEAVSTCPSLYSTKKENVDVPFCFVLDGRGVCLSSCGPACFRSFDC